MQEDNQKNKLKILFVITKSVWGGAGKYIYDLAANLPKEKFEVCVAAGGQNKLAQELKKIRINYSEIKNFQRDVNFFGDILAFLEIFRLIKRYKPDIMHANSSKAGSLAGIAAKIYSLLVTRYSLLRVFTAHGWAFNESRPKWQIILIKFFSRLTVLFYDKIICVSEFDRQMAIKNKIVPVSKLITIHNGIHFEEYKFFSRKEAIEKFKAQNLKLKTITQNLKFEKKIIIGTIGEFTKNKGQEYLIDAIKLLVTRYSLLVTIIGWGEKKQNLEFRIKNLGLENKVFLIENLIPAAPYLKAFDIFVLPSLKEGLPYTLLDAGLAGLAVIATDVGGNPEIIENKKTGLLVSPANADEIADAIKFLIENPAVSKNLSLNLRQKILQEFSLERMVNETLKIYNRGSPN